MRRMYSKQQLEEIAKYLVEHSELNFLEDIAFTGDVSIGGDLEVIGDASVGGDLPVVGKITGGEIIENMSGYSFTNLTVTDYTIEPVYVGIVKTGNKITFVWAGYITKLSTSTGGTLGYIVIPSSIGDKLYPAFIGTYEWLDAKVVKAFIDTVTAADAYFRISKSSTTQLNLQFSGTNLTVNTKYFARYEATFLLSDNMLPNP